MTSGSTASGGCTDATEPNDSIGNPGFFNDGGSGVQLCDHTGVSLSGALSDASDIDALVGYSDMSGSKACTPKPTASFTLASGADVCFYLQDDTNPVVNSCPTGLTMTSDPSGYTGCCGTFAGGAGMQSITITDVSDLFMTTGNTKFAVVLSKSKSAGCNTWSANVHF